MMSLGQGASLSTVFVYKLNVTQEQMSPLSQILCPTQCFVHLYDFLNLIESFEDQMEA